MRLFSRLKSSKAKRLPGGVTNCLINPYFSAKFIGSMCVAKPANGYEIMATVRHTRFEFKRRRFLKRRVKLRISLQEILICDEESKGFDNDMVLMRHSLCRVYYASHDNHDAKIFGYFADSDHKTHLQCNVFKADGEAQANAIVQEIGRCFEMFHMTSFATPFNKDFAYDESISNRESKSSGFEEECEDVLYAASGDVHKICDELRKLQKQSDDYQKELTDVRSRLHKLETKANEDLPAYLQAQTSRRDVIQSSEQRRYKLQAPEGCHFNSFVNEMAAKRFNSIADDTMNGRMDGCGKGDLRQPTLNAIYQVISPHRANNIPAIKCTNWKAICSQLESVSASDPRSTPEEFLSCL